MNRMNNRAGLKGSILLGALIISSYAFSSGASPKSTAALADGNAVYAAKCAICHGKDGRGLPNWRAKGQPDFTNATWQKSKTDAQIGDSIRNGKGKYMPAYKGKLSDDDINAVAARVRAFGKK
jgi:cbb3-type cytochrome c oxidase subunit III